MKKIFERNIHLPNSLTYATTFHLTKFISAKGKYKKPRMVLKNSQASSQWLVSIHLILIGCWNPAIWNPTVNHRNLALPRHTINKFSSTYFCMQIGLKILLRTKKKTGVTITEVFHHKNITRDFINQKFIHDLHKN